MLADHHSQLLEQDAWSYCWDDEDDEDEVERSKSIEEHASLHPPLFKSAPGEELPLKARLLLIGFRGAASNFLHCAFPQRSIVGTLQLPEVSLKGSGLSSLHSATHTACALFRLTQQDSSVLLLQCNYDVKEERAFMWTKTLFRHIQPERVVILFSMPRHKYKSRAFTGGLRLLETTAQQRERKATENKTVCDYLETPNTVEGAPAAVLSHCQLEGFKASLYVTAEEEGKWKETLQSFEPVLSSLNLLSTSSLDYHPVLPLLSKQDKNKPSADYLFM
ncbi:Proteasome assembly chaperone 1 [Balamuthia mandrillaris]